MPVVSKAEAGSSQGKRSATLPPEHEDASPAVAGDAKSEAIHAIGAVCIRALLERAGLPRHRHSAHIAGLLDLSYHQSHRRMAGTAPWSLEELQAVAVHHGETLASLFSGQVSESLESGVLIAGPLHVACRLRAGPALAQHRPGELIALRGGTEWVVMVAGPTPTPHAFAVKRLVIEPEPDRPKRFAILDDDFDVAQGLAAGLVDQGFEAIAFASEVQLEAALQSGSYDAYVIDWVLSGGTAQALVGRLRGRNASCPIALLTGKVGTLAVDESELVAAIKQHGLLFLQKPVTATITASLFSAAFSNR